MRKLVTDIEKSAEQQKIVDQICKAENKPSAKVSVKNLRRRGRYHGRTHTISIPLWTWGYGPEYVLWYTIHEAIHALGIMDHRTDFKRKETFWMKKFGMVPTYAKAYVKKIHSLNGECLYTRPKY